METKIIIQVKPYSLKEIAGLYGISTKTMYKWMVPLKNRIGEKRGRYYTVKQVRLIFDEIGLPGVIEI